MRNRLLIIIVALFFTLSSRAQTNRALLVVIDRYPAESGWNDIHAVNDLEIVSRMLVSNGYSKANISVLPNQTATKKAITEALDRLSRKSRAGDYVYIHFSCHGQQMADDNSDEPDGLDEALIPYDAKRRYSKGEYEGENHLRDDELGKILDGIRARIGPSGNLIVVMDACHSGTADRDADEDTFVRGSTYIFAPDDYVAQATDPDKVVLALSNDDRFASAAVFSACRPDQVNYEYKELQSGNYYGSLSYAFCRMVGSTDRNISTAAFCAGLKQQIECMFAERRRKQTPYFESTDDQKIFRIGR